MTDNNNISSVSNAFSTPEFWDKASENFIDDEFARHFLGFYCKEMIRLSGITKHDTTVVLNVLDVATGTGLVATEVAKQLDSRVTVSGIDFSPKMIEKAISKKGQLDIHYQIMDGQSLTFNDECFDYVFSLMGVIFYPDIPKGLKEIHRVLRERGKAVIAGWTNHNPASFMHQALSNIGISMGNGAVSLADVELFQKRMKDAGFSECQIYTLPCSLTMPYVHYENKITKMVPPTATNRMDEVKKSLHDLLQPLIDPKGFVTIAVEANIAVATK
jgi:ubiquinone/menaquinone biosynthesis C-methylase UbiE